MLAQDVRLRSSSSKRLYWWRYSEGVSPTFFLNRRLKYFSSADPTRFVEQGRIGRVVSVRAMMGEHFPDMRPDYKSTYYAQYSGAFELMHDLDLAIWFAGQPVQRVHAVYGSYSDIGIEAPDVAELLLDFADRCVATVHLDFFQAPRRRQLEIIGTSGTVIVQFGSWDQCVVSCGVRGAADWEHVQLETDRNDMFRDESRHFLQAVAAGTPVQCGIAEARKSLEVLQSALASSQRIEGTSHL
jgi:predicted dehydrogenase